MAETLFIPRTHGNMISLLVEMSHGQWLQPGGGKYNKKDKKDFKKGKRGDGEGGGANGRL